jgi:hypothetical protein
MIKYTNNKRRKRDRKQPCPSSKFHSTRRTEKITNDRNENSHTGRNYVGMVNSTDRLLLWAKSHLTSDHTFKLKAIWVQSIMNYNRLRSPTRYTLRTNEIGARCKCNVHHAKLNVLASCSGGHGFESRPQVPRMWLNLVVLLSVFMKTLGRYVKISSNCCFHVLLTSSSSITLSFEATKAISLHICSWQSVTTFSKHKLESSELTLFKYGITKRRECLSTRRNGQYLVRREMK